MMKSLIVVSVLWTLFLTLVIVALVATA